MPIEASLKVMKNFPATPSLFGLHSNPLTEIRSPPETPPFPSPPQRTLSTSNAIFSSNRPIHRTATHRPLTISNANTLQKKSLQPLTLRLKKESPKVLTSNADAAPLTMRNANTLQRIKNQNKKSLQPLTLRLQKESPKVLSNAGATSITALKVSL